EGEFVRMACGRPENEFGIVFGMEVDRLVRRLEDSEFARLNALGNGKASRAERDPAHGVIGRWIVAPGFAGLEAHSEVVHRGRRRKGARHGAVLAEQYGSGPGLADVPRRLVDAFGGPEFMCGRQGYPELEST